MIICGFKNVHITDDIRIWNTICSSSSGVSAENGTILFHAMSVSVALVEAGFLPITQKSASS